MQEDDVDAVSLAHNVPPLHNVATAHPTPSWNSSTPRRQHRVEVILLVHVVHIRRRHHRCRDVLHHFRPGRKTSSPRAVFIHYSLLRLPCPQTVFTDVLRVRPLTPTE